FIDRNSYQPGIKLRLALELSQVLVRLQECVLNHVFGILAILRNVLRNAKDVAVVTLHQRFESSYVALTGGIYQYALVSWLAYFGFDCFHVSVDSGISQKLPGKSAHPLQIPLYKAMPFYGSQLFLNLLSPARDGKMQRYLSDTATRALVRLTPVLQRL